MGSSSSNLERAIDNGDLMNFKRHLSELRLTSKLAEKIITSPVILDFVIARGYNQRYSLHNLIEITINEGNLKTFKIIEPWIPNDYNPLQIAISNNSLKIVKYLVNRS